MKVPMMMVVLALALSGVGCGGGSSGTTTESQSASTETSGDQTASARIVPPGEATIGDTSSCPVSGETFVVTADSPRVEHEGRTYYFCCAGCDARFQANPQQFLSPAPAAAAEAAPAS